MYNLDHVVLVDESDVTIGTAEKMEAHERGLLHRAFSIFVVNNAGEILLQRRAETKYHSGTRWANTCCGHPREHELIEAAARRRLREEMGFECELQQVGVFLYRAPVGRGLIEHEIDHLFVGTFTGSPVPNPDEVSEWQYVSLTSLSRRLSEFPDQFAAWFPIAFNHVRSHLSAWGAS